MIEILRKMFEANPEKSTIVLKAKCSECGREATIHITPTSGGFGFQGGALFKCSVDGYLVKCPGCYQSQGKPRISTLKIPRKNPIDNMRQRDL
jgi:ribosomal protein S27E